MNLFKRLTPPVLAQWGSAALVFASGATVGHAAQGGLTVAQTAGGVAAILGSISLAVLVRIPAKARGRA